MVMAKGSDLTGRSGAGGFGTPAPGGQPLKQHEGALNDKSGKKFQPPRDQKGGKGQSGGAGGIGGAPTSVRPKV